MYEPDILKDDELRGLLEHIESCLSDLLDHSIRVGALSMQVGKDMCLSKEDLSVLYYSALLHDYGKIFIPKEVLEKQDLLLPGEILIVEKHVLLGCAWLSRFTHLPNTVLKNISQHHERLDGSGYPKHSRAVSTIANIIAVTDVFDALTHKRCYKAAYPVDYAISYLEKEGGKKFDKEIIKSFKRVQQYTDTSNCTVINYDC